MSSAPTASSRPGAGGKSAEVDTPGTGAILCIVSSPSQLDAAAPRDRVDGPVLLSSSPRRRAGLDAVAHEPQDITETDRPRFHRGSPRPVFFFGGIKPGSSCGDSGTDSA